MTIKLPKTPEPFPAPIHFEKQTLQEKEKIAGWRQTIGAILNRKDPRFLVILGPCSIHDQNGALAYAHRLKKLSTELSSQFFFVMRTYVEKGRTRKGWKGFLNDPNLNGSSDLFKGITLSRSLLKELTHLDIPCASEFVDPLLAPYYSDWISWGCIGARTSNSQPHRQLASSLPFPVGFKNTTDGNIEIAVDGIISALDSHAMLMPSLEGGLSFQHTSGNPFSHLVLRGGTLGPNATSEHLILASSLLKNANHSPSLLIDCSHGNSNKFPERQKNIFSFSIEMFSQNHSSVRGALIESHIEMGAQEMTHSPSPFCSITDPCLSWEETEVLLQTEAEKYTKNEVLCASSL